MRRQFVFAVLALVALLAMAPSWNDTTCDRTTPVPTAWNVSPAAEAAAPPGALVDYGARGVPGPGIIGIP
jgi:hypothetical protein